MPDQDQPRASAPPSDRYRLPDPKCNHATRTVRVTSGSFDGAHASTWVCDRETCVEDAKAWAFASTHIEPTLFVKEATSG